MRVYIAGPMRGFPEFNFPTFDAVAQAVRERGWYPVNPADHDREVALDQCGVQDITTVAGYKEGDLSVYETTLGAVYDLLTWDVARIAESCQGIVLLPGWEKSTGARIERFVAEALDKDVYLAGPILDGWDFWLDPQQRRMELTVKELWPASTLKVS